MLPVVPLFYCPLALFTKEKGFSSMQQKADAKAAWADVIYCDRSNLNSGSSLSSGSLHFHVKFCALGTVYQPSTHIIQGTPVELA